MTVHLQWSFSQLHINLKGLRVQISLFVRNETMHWFTMLKVCWDHRTCVKVYRSPHGEPRVHVPLWHKARASILHCSLYSVCADYHNHNYKISHNATADVISLWVAGLRGSPWHTANKWWPQRCRNVARMTRAGIGPLYDCILMLPIQKAHIYTHTHDKKIFWSQVYKSSSTVLRNKKTWTIRVH